MRGSNSYPVLEVDIGSMRQQVLGDLCVAFFSSNRQSGKPILVEKTNTTVITQQETLTY